MFNFKCKTYNEAKANNVEYNIIQREISFFYFG